MKPSNRRVIQALSQPGAYLSPVGRIYHVRLATQRPWESVIDIRQQTIDEMKAAGLIEYGTLMLLTGDAGEG